MPKQVKSQEKTENRLKKNRRPLNAKEKVLAFTARNRVDRSET
jgi:hypothetical protein